MNDVPDQAQIARTYLKSLLETFLLANGFNQAPVGSDRDLWVNNADDRRMTVSMESYVKKDQIKIRYRLPCSQMQGETTVHGEDFHMMFLILSWSNIGKYNGRLER